MAGEAELGTEGGLLRREGEGVAAPAGVVVVGKLGAAAEGASGGEDRDREGATREVERVRRKGWILAAVVEQSCLGRGGIAPEA
jgi:hypothetical protein